MNRQKEKINLSGENFFAFKYWASKKVQCVPGGHQITLSEAYWCGGCGWYICYKHLKKAIMTTAKTCPKGHDVTRAN